MAGDADEQHPIFRPLGVALDDRLRLAAQRQPQGAVAATDHSAEIEKDRGGQGLNAENPQLNSAHGGGVFSPRECSGRLHPHAQLERKLTAVGRGAGRDPCAVDAPSPVLEDDRVVQKRDDALKPDRRAMLDAHAREGENLRDRTQRRLVGGGRRVRQRRQATERDGCGHDQSAARRHESALPVAPLWCLRLASPRGGRRPVADRAQARSSQYDAAPQAQPASRDAQPSSFFPQQASGRSRGPSSTPGPDTGRIARSSWAWTISPQSVGGPRAGEIVGGSSGSPAACPPTACPSVAASRRLPTFPRASAVTARLSL